MSINHKLLIVKDERQMDYQAIKNPAEARRLLKLGNPIYDIAPKKEQGKENETVFFFEKTDKLCKDLGWKK